MDNQWVETWDIKQNKICRYGYNKVVPYLLRPNPVFNKHCLDEVDS